MEGWPIVRLGDVADMLTGYPFKSDQYTPDNSGIRLIRGDNIVQGTLRWDGVKRWPVSQASAFTSYELEPDDVVLAMDRPWIEAGLKYASIRESDCPALLVQRVTRLRRTDRLDGRYLSYVIGSSAFTRHVLAVQTGTAVPHISGGQIKAFEFALPPMTTQQGIAAALSALDDKIELNRRMNETLEASARALFRDWFVDFGPTRAKAEGRPAWLDPDLWSLFPDRLGDDGVPQGWNSYTVGDLAQQHTATINPATTGDEPFEHYSLPAFDNGASPAIDRGDSIRSNKTLVPTGAVLLSKLNPEISRVWMPNPADEMRQVASTEFLAFVPKAQIGRSLLFAMFRDATFRQIMEGMVTGTSKSHQRISPPALRATQALIGMPPVFEAFDRIASPLTEQMLKHRLESRTLAATRDALLPKLMSGAIRVRDAQMMAEALL